jgi:hypothetical protein
VESQARQVEGIRDARIDPERMELVLSVTNERLDLSRLVESLRRRGFDAKPVR